MKTIKLTHNTGACHIHIGDKIIQHITNTEWAKNGNQFTIITDKNVRSLYAKKIEDDLKSLNKDVITITLEPGEKTKTRQTKQFIEDEMLSQNYGRDSIIIAIGGGIVTDITGFVASTYCRGIRLIYIPTTLLAMVDAAIGGKTAVNTSSGKNLIGTFYQPNHVYCDIDTLKTLSHDELANGLSESIKHALITDKALFNKMGSILDAFSSNQPINNQELIEIVLKSCRIKCDVVMKDEHENGGIRQLLNFGHTIAHAIEKELNYSISHGQAVLAGLWCASCLSNILNFLSDDEFIRIKHALNKITYNKKLSLSKHELSQLKKHMRLDKKSINRTPRFVLLNHIGSARVIDNQYSFTVNAELVDQALTLWHEEQ